MFFRTLIAASLLAAPALAANAKACDASCKVETLLTHNVGIALDKKVSIADIKKLGKVKGDNLEKRASAYYPGKFDIVHHVMFDGLTVNATVTPDHNVLVERIKLTGGTFSLPFGLKLGPIKGLHDIDFVLGQPTETHRTGNAMDWVYSNLEQTESVTFHRTDKAILSVIWEYGGD
ncbi:MAG: hypothetical protein HY269_03855 [Deltaproteobacteria bacterium]|nr:hypothetical protein [Deltaproteobacteria bacterium]